MDGDQRLDNDIEIQNGTVIPFFLHWPPSLGVPDSCGDNIVYPVVNKYSGPSPGCFETYTFNKMGIWSATENINNIDSGDVSGQTYGTVGTYTNLPETSAAAYYKIEITIPSFKEAGNYGFSIQFVNGISSIKFGTMDVNSADNMKPSTEIIQLLDPAPVGTGEWVQVVVPKWDFVWVKSIFFMISNPQSLFNVYMKIL